MLWRHRCAQRLEQQRGLDASQVWIRCYPDEDRANGVAAGHPRPNPTGAEVATLRADLSELWPSTDPVVVHISDETCDRLPSSLPKLQQMMTSVGAFQVVVMPMGVALSLLGYVVIGFPGGRGPLRASELDAIAVRLNGRPRKTLGFATPDEVFAALVDKAANAVTSQNAKGVRYGT